MVLFVVISPVNTRKNITLVSWYLTIVSRLLLYQPLMIVHASLGICYSIYKFSVYIANAVVCLKESSVPVENQFLLLLFRIQSNVSSWIRVGFYKQTGRMKRQDWSSHCWWLGIWAVDTEIEIQNSCIMNLWDFKLQFS